MNQASNRLIWILGAALVIALMTIAFLLGRDSRSTETSATPVANVEPARAPIAAGHEGVVEIVAYFAKVDSIQAGPAGMSADAFAQQLAAEASQGKVEGFDQLQTDLDRMEGELRAITPPPPCREFHELSLASTADARALMKDLREAFAGGSAANVQLLAIRAQAAQDKTKQVEAARKAVETQYGLVR